jgi:hypothetical protein
MNSQLLVARIGQRNAADMTIRFPGAWARTRYKIQSTDNSGLPRDGRHKGIMVADKTLRLIAGGQHCFGSVINSTISDFFVYFDDDYHDEFKRGLERAYKGKRRCSDRYFLTRSTDWQDGYREGQRARQDVAA